MTTPKPVAVSPGESRLRVALVGLGAIGKILVNKLGRRGLPGIELVAITARDKEKAEHYLKNVDNTIRVVPLDELPQVADLAIECASGHVLEQIARLMLGSGKKVVVLSVGALLSHPDLVEFAKQHKGQIIVPTGALIGLDAVAAAAEGTIRSVRMQTLKPVKGLLGAPYLVEHNIIIERIKERVKVFEGSAREAVSGFPANMNVAAALALAGIGPDRTILEIWADPTLDRNIHHIFVDSDVAGFQMTIRNVPSDNPKTGQITPLSVIAALRKLSGALCIGT
jgi:aspartate dehydrogenase